MHLLYESEHVNCRNYDEAQPPVQLLEMDQERVFAEQSVYSKIIFLLKGELSCSFGVYHQYIMPERHFLFLPHNCHFTFKANEDSELLVLRLTQTVQFCENYQIEDLMQQTKKHLKKLSKNRSESPHVLKINERLIVYIRGLQATINAGLRCRCFFEIKTKELFYLLRAFYPKEELAMLFETILSPDSRFSNFVMSNYHKYSTLSEMADDMGMSLSNIEKQFAKVFRTSGYKWMNKRRAEQIYHALCTEDAPLKELAERFDFSSTSSFNDFCKNTLGDTPGAIRRKRHD